MEVRRVTDHRLSRSLPGRFVFLSLSRRGELKRERLWMRSWCEDLRLRRQDQNNANANIILIILRKLRGTAEGTRTILIHILAAVVVDTASLLFIQGKGPHSPAWLLCPYTSKPNAAARRSPLSEDLRNEQRVLRTSRLNATLSPSY